VSDYKHTLNLPRTEFPMKANLANREPELLTYWDSIDLYAKLRELGRARPRFVQRPWPVSTHPTFPAGTVTGCRSN
jgi:isoleucyl-tRNA synthetase